MTRSEPRRRRRWLVISSSVIGGLAVLAGGGYLAQFGHDPEPVSDGTYPHISSDTSIGYLMHSPAFEGYADMVSPLAPDSIAVAEPLALRAVMPYMKPWDEATTIAGINFLIDQVNANAQVYFPLWKRDDVERDPSKAASGMVFLPGDPGAPFAMVMPGGGFRALAGGQEAFPYAQRLHEDGYNVFVLHYRVGVPEGDDQAAMTARAMTAAEDLAQAMKLIDMHQDEWHVSFNGYSVWGSSAGGTLALQWGSDLAVGAVANDLPLPSAIVTAYPASWTWPGATDTSPPLYVTSAADDELIPISDVDEVVDAMEAAGRPVQYQRNETGGHGYGLGRGLDAEGWIDDAIAFWRAQS